MTLNLDLQVSGFGMALVQSLDSLDPLRIVIEGSPTGCVGMQRFVQIVVEICYKAGITTVQPSDLAVRIKQFESRDLEEQSIAQWTSLIQSRWTDQVHELREGALNYFANASILEYCCCELFRCVDRERRGTVTWSDLIAYLVDGTTKQSSTVGIQPVSIQPYSRSFEEFHRDLNVVKRIVFMENRYRDATLPAPIRRAQYVCISRGTLSHDVVKTLLPNLRVEVSLEQKPEWGRPECIEYVARTEAVATAFSDGIVRVYDAGNAHRISYKDKRRQTVSCLRWIDKSNCLAVGTRTGMISMIDISDQISRQIYVENTVPVEALREFQGPNDLVTDILPVLVSNSVVSCGLDGLIVLHNEETQERKEFKGHKAAVSSLSFNASYSLLISAGADREPHAWTLNVPNVKPIKFSDTKPHLVPIVRVYCVPDTPRVLSMDQKGIIKVWDIRNYLCAQTFCMDPDHGIEIKRDLSIQWHDFAYNTSQDAFYSVSKKVVHGFEYNITERSWELSGASEHAVTSVLFVKRTLTFVTASRGDLRTWDAVSGKPVETYEVTTTSEITVAGLDAPQRRVYVGMRSGELACVDLGSGVVLFLTKALQNDILHLCICKRHNVIVVVGAEETAYVNFDTTRGGETKLETTVMQLMKRPVQAACVAYCNELGHILIGEEPSRLTLWSPVVSHGDFMRLNILKNVPYEDTEVSVIIPMGSYGGAICADSSSNIHIWGLSSPHWAVPYSCIGRWRNESSEGSHTDRVTSLAFLALYRYLYVGDSSGTISMYSIDQMISCNLREELGVPGTVQLKEGRRLYKERAHQLEVSCLTFVSHPWVLVSSSPDGHVALWTLALVPISRLCRDPASIHFKYTMNMTTPDEGFYNDVVLPEKTPISSTLVTDSVAHPTNSVFLTGLVNEEPLINGPQSLNLDTITKTATLGNVLLEVGKIKPQSEPSSPRHSPMHKSQKNTILPYSWKPKGQELKYRLEDLPDEVIDLVYADSDTYMMYLREVSTMTRKTQLRCRSVTPSMFQPPRYEGPPVIKTSGEKQPRMAGVLTRGSLCHLPPVAYRSKKDPLKVLKDPPPAYPKDIARSTVIPDMKNKRLQDHLAKHHTNLLKEMAMPPVMEKSVKRK